MCFTIGYNCAKYTSPLRNVSCYQMTVAFNFRKPAKISRKNCETNRGRVNLVGIHSYWPLLCGLISYGLIIRPVQRFRRTIYTVTPTNVRSSE